MYLILIANKTNKNKNKKSDMFRVCCAFRHYNFSRLIARWYLTKSEHFDDVTIDFHLFQKRVAHCHPVLGEDTTFSDV
jgi:hypothetical protein